MNWLFTSGSQNIGASAKVLPMNIQGYTHIHILFLFLRMYQTQVSHIAGGSFTGGSVVKNLPAMQEAQEMQFRSLGQEEPLEEKMATLSSILA